jgi:hypothetical protein
MRKHPATTWYLLYLFVFLNGCDMTERTGVSDDLAELQKIVELDFNPRSVQWEIFGTPEHTGGVPGPTDFVTLIVEVPSLKMEEFERRSKSGAIWVAPEAMRTWLSPAHRSTLAKYRNKSVDVSRLPSCRVAQGKLKKTREVVHGFVCNDPVKAFVYLTLADFSKT